MKQVIAAVEFGTSKIACLVGENRSGGRFDVIGAGTSPYAGFRYGSFLEPEAVEDAIYAAVRKAEIESRRRIRELVVSVPGECVRVMLTRDSVPVSSRDRRVAPDDVSRLMKKSEDFYKPDRYQVIHRCPVSFFTADQKRVIDPIGIKSPTLGGEIAYVTADSLVLDKITKQLGDLGMSVGQFMVETYAQAMTFIPAQDRDRVCVLVDCGYFTTDVAIIEGDGIVYHVSIPVGGYHITADLAYGLDIVMEDAERIKRRYGFGMISPDGRSDLSLVMGNETTRRFSVHKLSRIVEPRVDEMVELIEEAVLDSGYRLGMRSGLYLAGGGLAAMRGARQYLSAAMARQVQILQPNTPRFNSSMYTGLIAMVDYAFQLQQGEGSRRGGYLRFTVR